ncbi:MAG: hypothetical protein KUL86_10670 [Castellaniella sp.]|nr:hypothetical protein [Castellaniella sp.]
MFHQIMLVALSGFAISAVAANDAQKHTPQETCKHASELAEKIMLARQSGFPAADAMDVAGDSEIVRRMVIQAYKSPKFLTEESKKAQAVEFGNRMYVECAGAIMQ